MPHGEKPPAPRYLATASCALVAPFAQEGDGAAWVPVEICHRPKLDCVPLLSFGLSAELHPPDSARAMAAATGACAFGPPALIQSP